MFLVGMSVRTLPPFDGAFPDIYTIRSIEGSTAFLDGIPEGFADAFDFDHLVLA
jgi:hypothetical protein